MATRDKGMKGWFPHSVGVPIRLTDALLGVILLLVAVFSVGGFLYFRFDNMLTPAPALDPPFPGVTVVPADPPDGGLLVTSVRFGSEAEKQGVAVGDDILRVDGQPARLPRRNAGEAGSGMTSIQLQLLHGSMLRSVTLHPSLEGMNGTEDTSHRG
jgi:serine protease Do